MGMKGSTGMRKHKIIFLGSVLIILLVGMGLFFLVVGGFHQASEALMPTQTPHPQWTIGTVQVAEKDGMVMVYIPSGEFIMGTPKGASNERPEHVVYLDAYWIDQTEITNAMYRQCVNEGACISPDRQSSATRPTYFTNSKFDHYPVVYVDWGQAADYCEWVGRRLPTEAEWEKAARGTDGRTYPWGNELPSADFGNFEGEFGDTTPVGDFEGGASPYHALDMAGNVFEWAWDCFDSHYYRTSPSQNPQGPSNCEHQHRVIRGGSSWRVLPHSSPGIADRLNNVTTAAGDDLGFRCAVSARPDETVLLDHQSAYFGQAPPGLSPQPFAPEIFSTEGEFGLLLHSSLYFSEDGKEVLFAHQSKETMEVIAMLMERGERGVWNAPREIGFPMNRGEIVWHNPVDGSLSLYAYTDQLGPPFASKKGFHLWVVDWIGDHWSEPYSVVKSDLESGMIYFSANLEGGLGGEDIYAMEIRDGQERNPVNLGTPINTRADECITVMPEYQSFIIFYRFDPADKESRGLYLSYQELEPSWTQPLHLDPIFGFEKVGFDASISPDGQYLFLLERGVGVYWMDLSGIDALLDKSRIS
jgi:formylglycine-generating enzyme required for sulfatase activity